MKIQIEICVSLFSERQMCIEQLIGWNVVNKNMLSVEEPQKLLYSLFMMRLGVVVVFKSAFCSLFVKSVVFTRLLRNCGKLLYDV